MQLGWILLIVPISLVVLLTFGIVLSVYCRTHRRHESAAATKMEA